MGAVHVHIMSTMPDNVDVYPCLIIKWSDWIKKSAHHKCVQIYILTKSNDKTILIDSSKYKFPYRQNINHSEFKWYGKVIDKNINQ